MNHFIKAISFLFVIIDPKSEPSHMCDQCGKVFYSPHQLTRHMQTHGEPTFKCPDCPQLFRTSSAVCKHRHIHSNVKFVCPFCKAEYTTTASLKSHIGKPEMNLIIEIKFLNEIKFVF